jgi:hypothetical protein
MTSGAIAARLGLTPVERLDSGGSDSVCLLVTDSGGARYVLKYLESGADRVDGHGVRTFRAKHHQQQHLTRIAPGVAARYLPVLHAEHQRGWSALLLPYSPHPTVAELGRTLPPEDFVRLLNAIIGALVDEGYALGGHPSDPALWHGTYLGRLTRRWWILRSHLPDDLQQDAVVINGRRVATMRHLHQIAGAPEIAGLFAGSRLSYPVHGDLNLRNMLAAPGSSDTPVFHLIDPRGTDQPWDILYDLAKILFTLTLFDDAMRTGFTIASTAPGEYTVGLAGPSGLRHTLPAFTATLPSLWARLEAAGLGDGPWPARLLLAHATHVLAESACRLSDRAAPLPTRLNRAVGLHLSGLLLLDDLLHRLPGGEPLDDHLAILEEPTWRASVR